MQNIGFIGLGNIGRGICKNIIKGGYPVTAYDMNPQAMARFEGKAVMAASPVEVLQKSEIVFFSLPDSKAVGGVMEQFFHEGVAGKTIVDTSTSYPLATKELFSKTESMGGYYVDAPLLAGPAEADAGILEICVGGRKADFDRLTPIFDTYCSKYTYIGESGSGHLAKLAINFVGGVYSACLAQAFPVMEKLGIARDQLYNIFDCEPLANGVFRFYGKKFAERNWHLDFALKLAMKDYYYVKQLHDDLGVEGFLLDSTIRMCEMALEAETRNAPNEIADASCIGKVMEQLLKK